MFTQSARFYDAIYAFKDYGRESQMLLEILADKKAGTLLDVACGTGKHLEHLREHFTCEGLDLDENLLALLKERMPGVTVHLGDMVSFDLGKQFDVVTCLFSAIGYVETFDRLVQALACFAAHAKAGGVVVVEPWFGPEQWNLDHLHALFIDEPDLKLARMSQPGREGDVSTVRFEYLVATRQGIERATEDHRLGLFTKDQYLDAFRRTGLTPHYLEEGLMGRGLYLAVKPSG